MKVTMATLGAPTTRHHHTERISGLLTYPYLLEIMTGREGMGVKDLQRSLRMKGSTMFAHEQSQLSMQGCS